MALVIKARTVGADRPAPKPQSADEQMAIAMQWAAVAPGNLEQTEVIDGQE